MSSLLAQHLREAHLELIPSSAAQRRKLISQQRTRTYRIADAAMLSLAAVTAVIAGPGATTVRDLAWGVVYAVLTIVILQVRGFYRSRLHDAAVDTIARVFAATSIAAMVLTFTRALFYEDPELMQQTLRLWAFALVFLGAGRLGITLDRQRALRRGAPGLNTLIIGSGRVGHLIAQRLLDRPELGLRPIGFLDKDPLIERYESRDDRELPVLGASWDLEEVVARHDVSQVVVTFSTAPHAVLLSMIRRCRQLGVEVAVVPRLFEEVNSRVAIEHLGGLPLLRAEQIDPKGWQFTVKYAIDRVIAAIALVALAPVLAALAIAVRVSSPGPILYRQWRVGLDGHEFDMLKFRSMRVSDKPDDYTPPDGCAPGGVEGEDRRTRIGELMRRTSLDELPQLLNVLRGDMSLVGPRPERTSFARDFQKRVYRYGDRHRVKSGLTGWAQVQGLRGQTSLSDRVEWDNFYIENWSLLLDLKIVLMTLPALLGRSSVE